MYHSGWAWAGTTPFRSTKLVAAHLGGTRNPLVISWPKGIKPDAQVRSQFTHVVDVVPTLYDILGITPPKVVNGHLQMPFDGASFRESFADADAPEHNTEQFFDNNGSRALYQDGWMACAFGSFYPWNQEATRKLLATWDSATEPWSLYNLKEDFSQAHDLAAQYPEKLEQMKKRYLEIAAENKALPIGAGAWLRYHPEDRVKTSYTEWTFSANTRRMPEFTAPGIGRESTTVTIQLECNEQAGGVLYALGGSGGGVTVYLDGGHLVYLYNMMIIEQYSGRSPEPLAAGEHTITVNTDIERVAGPAEVVVSIDGQEAFRVDVKRTVPAAFTASESFDVGADLGSTVSLDYYEMRPFEFSGKIEKVHVKLQ